MPVKKKFIKTKNVYNCTFTVPKKNAQGASTINLVGEFNEWKKDALPMKQLKNGDFKVDVALKPGQSYQYRFLLDESSWENDPQADAYIPIPEFSTNNSVVNVM